MIFRPHAQHCAPYCSNTLPEFVTFKMLELEGVSLFIMEETPFIVSMSLQIDPLYILAEHGADTAIAEIEHPAAWFAV